MMRVAVAITLRMTLAVAITLRMTVAARVASVVAIARITVAMVTRRPRVMAFVIPGSRASASGGMGPP